MPVSKPNFQWPSDLGANRNIKPAVTQTKFGDGYELRAANGINFRPKVWKVQFTYLTPEAMQILDFLEARGGLESFTWTDPLDKVGTYVCREWDSVQDGFGMYDITGQFEQVFEI
jgi:phage-related protein